MEKRKKENLDLRSKFRKLLLGIGIPFLFVVILLFCFFGYYAARYNGITHNVAVSSSFSINFKSNMDLKMYYYSIGNSQQKTLPIEDLKAAINIAESLKETTDRKESRVSLNNLLEYCGNLEKKMYQMADTKNYDSRKMQLENNIYILTNLIQDEIQNYIYYEAGYMAALERQFLEYSSIAMILLIAVCIVLMVWISWRSIKFSAEISKPVTQLCGNVRSVGKGEFDIDSVKTYDCELETLNQGIQKMAHRIQLLLKNVKEEEEKQRKTELKLIQAQVNPHFLYNTLDAIIWLVEAGNREEAVNMVASLSVFFRTSLSKGNDIITLKEEMMHTDSYLQIQQMRYKDILNYTIEIPEEFYEVKLPKLTIQPLVENAIYHGVKCKREPGHIVVTAEEKGGVLILCVTDDGPGIGAEQLARIRNAIAQGEKIGFGISAVQERIQLYYGSKYGIGIRSEIGEGTTISVRIPKAFPETGLEMES